MTTESNRAVALRAVIKMSRLGHTRSFTGDQLLELAHWFEGKISREILEALIDKLEEIEDEHLSAPEGGTKAGTA